MFWMRNKKIHFRLFCFIWRLGKHCPLLFLPQNVQDTNLALACVKECRGLIDSRLQHLETKDTENEHILVLFVRPSRENLNSIKKN